MMYVIEKDVPMPKLPSALRVKGSSKYPFARMEVGDSFFSATNAQSAALRYGRSNNMRFSARKLEVGYRIWRVV